MRQSEIYIYKTEIESYDSYIWKYEMLISILEIPFRYT